MSYNVLSLQNFKPFYHFLEMNHSAPNSEESDMFFNHLKNLARSLKNREPATEHSGFPISAHHCHKQNNFSRCALKNA